MEHKNFHTRERERGTGSRQTDRQTDRQADRQTNKERLTDRTLFLNGENTNTKADSPICRCYSTTNSQDILSEILL